MGGFRYTTGIVFREKSRYVVTSKAASSVSTLIPVKLGGAHTPFHSTGRPLSCAGFRRPIRQQPLFLADAFSNLEYVSFALKGCLAASICYVFWSAVAWPGLGVSTVTCLLAAPVGILGSSRQRLTTRLCGLFFGGVICGIGSQVLLLPQADSIVGFILPLAFVSAIAAWFATASPRLNYFGRQMALAYYITIFQGFGVSTTLIASRDRFHSARSRRRSSDPAAAKRLEVRLPTSIRYAASSAR
jgi:hypothetical protein